jgi:hypothetical protein
MDVNGQLHAPAALSLEKEPHGSHWIGVWIVSRDGLEAVVKRKIPAPAGESNPGHSARSPVTILTELPRLI